MNSYGKIKLYLSEFFLLLLLCTASVPVIHGQDQSLFNEIKKHTIQLTSYFSGEQENGFGFVVSEKSGFLYIVTARHLLFKYDDYERKYIKAESVKARFFEDMGVCYDNITILDIKMRELDLALIRLGKPGFGFEFSGGCFSSPVKRGDSVWFIGKGKKWYIPVIPGAISEEPDLNGIMTVEITTVRPGTSGAPLVTEKGISGLIITDNDDIAKAIHIDTIKQFVERFNYPWQEIGRPMVARNNTKSQEAVPGMSGARPARYKNSIGMEFVYIKPGEFMMGADNGEDGEKPVHKVKITNGFYMQTTEVTQGQWYAVMENNPSSFKDCGDDCPVEKGSWNDIQDFLKKLNRKENTNRYRLPTEAQWEYAARAGTGTEYFWGDKADCYKTNYGAGWIAGWSEECKGINPGKTMKVGSFTANKWGLHDMHGNVWEWVEDWYGSDFYKRSPLEDPVNKQKSKYRVLRGGSWINFAGRCRSASRLGYVPGFRASLVGFRVLRSLPL